MDEHRIGVLGFSACVTGWTKGEIDGQPPVPAESVFLTCLDANGEKQWTQRWGGSDGSANTIAPSNTLSLRARAHVWGPHPRRDELTWLPADTVDDRARL